MARSLQLPHALSHHSTGLRRCNPGLESRALSLSLPQNRSYRTISTSLSSVTRYNDFRLSSLVVDALGPRATSQGKRSSRQRIVAEAEGSDSKEKKIQPIAQKVFNFLAKTPIKVFLQALEKVVDKLDDAFGLGVRIVTVVDNAAGKAEITAKKMKGIADDVKADLDTALGVEHDNGNANPVTVTSTEKSTSTPASKP